MSRWVHPWFQIFSHQNTSILIACQKIKIKRSIFPLISVVDVKRRACFVFIPRREGKLVNISVSVDAIMLTLDVNADETRYDRCVELSNIASKKA